MNAYIYLAHTDGGHRRHVYGEHVCVHYMQRAKGEDNMAQKSRSTKLVSTRLNVLFFSTFNFFFQPSFPFDRAGILLSLLSTRNQKANQGGVNITWSNHQSCTFADEWHWLIFCKRKCYAQMNLQRQKQVV